MMATVFVGCGSDDDGGSSDCKACDDIAGIEGLDIEICDNGDGTATLTTSFLGEVESEDIDLDGESIDDLDCSDFAGFDLGSKTK